MSPPERSFATISSTSATDVFAPADFFVAVAVFFFAPAAFFFFAAISHPRVRRNRRHEARQARSRSIATCVAVSRDDEAEPRVELARTWIGLHTWSRLHARVVRGADESTNERAADATAAVAATKKPQGLGGTVVIVTNRLDAVECPATEDNLKALGVAYDAIICKKDTNDKNPCFTAVAAGNAVRCVRPFRTRLSRDSFAMIRLSRHVVPPPAQQ
jgi:hypothetical protein